MGKRELVRGEKARDDVACNVLGELRAAGLMVALSMPEMLEGNITGAVHDNRQRQQAARQENARWDEVCVRQRKRPATASTLHLCASAASPRWSWPPSHSTRQRGCRGGIAAARQGQIQARLGRRLRVSASGRSRLRTVALGGCHANSALRDGKVHKAIRSVGTQSRKRKEAAA